MLTYAGFIWSLHNDEDGMCGVSPFSFYFIFLSNSIPIICNAQSET